MIRLVATDVDGTLVKDGSHVLDPAYFDMIRRLRRKGVYVCVCSGRQYHSIHHLFAPVAGELFFLAENGTLVRTEEKILQTWPIDPDYYIPLIRDIRKIDGAAAVVCSPRIARVEAGEDSEVYRFLKEGYSYMLENIPDLTTIPSGEVLKLSVYHERAEKGLLPLTSSHWAEDLALEPSTCQQGKCPFLPAGSSRYQKRRNALFRRQHQRSLSLRPGRAQRHSLQCAQGGPRGSRFCRRFLRESWGVERTAEDLCPGSHRIKALRIQSRRIRSRRI